MNIRELVQNKKLFSFQLDDNLDIEAINYDLYTSGGKNLLKTNIESVLRDLFCNEEFCNKAYILELLSKIRHAFDEKSSYVEQIVVSDTNLKSPYSYSFSLGIEVIMMMDIPKVVLKFNNFEKSISKEDLYQKILIDIEEEFDVFSMIEKIGRFVIDYSNDSPIIFADQNFPELLGITKSSTNHYRLSDNDSHNEPTITQEVLLGGAKLLFNNELIVFSEEFVVKHKWIRCNMKTTKRDEDGNCLIVSGVVYDISNINKFKDIEYLYTIYELAITSGGIGIFHYNLDNHSKEYFDCNVIYKRMFGLEQQENGYYCLSDFTKSILPLEDEISDNMAVLKSLGNLLQGDIEGTTDDILKVINHKTNEIKYLLSSSKIDQRFDDGTPRRFGGIVIDITDRINKEKKQITFAYMDELTGLANNRKLFKDLRNKTSGVGLFFDLDNFKKINDEYGHLFGDKVLSIYASCLLEISGQFENVIPYRLYGDEFFVFAEGFKEEFAFSFNGKLKALVAKRMFDLKPNISISASMGYSVLEDTEDLDEFVKLADYAMYKEKIKRRDIR
jgi:diguanylate cyclase (GGDEF)-like protein